MPSESSSGSFVARRASWRTDRSRRCANHRGAKPRHATHREPPLATRSRFRRSPRDGHVTPAIAEEALQREGVDELGLDRLDRAFLRTIVEQYRGGPAGIAAIAATLTEDAETLEDVVEPYLLKEGFVTRTASGRRATARAYQHLGLSGGTPAQERLL